MLSETNFKDVPNLNDYVQQNRLQFAPASKFQRIQAQSGEDYIKQWCEEHGKDPREIDCAPLTTIAGDGTVETNNMVSRNKIVANNVGNPDNKWVIDNETFKRKYEPDPSQSGVYKPKGGPMNATQISEPISFTAPWGEKMNIDKGGYILQDPNSPNDIYGISQKDFNNTYRFVTENNRITESQLRNIIREVLEEVKGYSDTM